MTEKHSIEVENGKEVSAVHHDSGGEKWIFFCHGFGSNKEGSYEKRSQRAVEKGWNAVRFDFRGNGESDGDFIEQGLSDKIDDLRAVIDYFDPGTYVLFGSSFGGKVVLHSLEGLEPEALVLKAPVTFNDIMEKYRAVVENKGEYTHHPGATVDRRFYEDFDSYSFQELAGEIDVPVAIFHGADDTTVHFGRSLEAVREVEGDVALYKLRGEKHSFSEEAEEKMQAQMFRWLEALLDSGGD